MLRIQFYETAHGITVRLQGRFVKEFAEHACMLIGKSSEPSRFVVDLSDVTFVDAVGERVLIWFKEMGVGFTADSAYCLDICERLSLPLAATRSRANRRATREHTGVPSNKPAAPKDLEARIPTFSLAGETEPERLPSGSTADLPHA